MSHQTTLCGALRRSGIALHSGHPVAVTLMPAPQDHGLVFVANGQEIPAHVDQVVDTQLATTLGHGSVTVRTVEHLLATLVGMGIDNVRIEVEGNELPALDGCGEAWVRAIHEVGLRQQESLKRVVEIVCPIEVTDGDRWARIEPSSQLTLDVTIDFDHASVGRQHLCLDIESGSFERELAWARTFGFERHVPAMQRMGLVRGGTLDNALVFGEDGPLNPGGLKRADEPVRHKMLDVLGDLALLGSSVHGRIVTERPGHGLIVRLIQRVVDQPNSWQVR